MAWKSGTTWFWVGENAARLRPLHNRAVVHRYVPERLGRIVLPDTTREITQRTWGRAVFGKILQVARTWQRKKGQAAVPVAPGDVVVVSTFAGKDVTGWGDEPVFLATFEEIHAVVDVPPDGYVLMDLPQR